MVHRVLSIVSCMRDGVDMCVDTGVLVALAVVTIMRRRGRRFRGKIITAGFLAGGERVRSWARVSSCRGARGLSMMMMGFFRIH